MAWSADFLDACSSSTRAPVYYIEALPSSTSSSWSHGATWAACSARGYGVEAIVAQVDWTPPTLSMQTWQATMGSVRVTLTGWASAVDRLKRGVILVLRQGYAGWPIAEFATISLGRLRGLRIAGGTCVLAIDGPESLLVTRQAYGASSQVLFAGVSAADTIATGYTAGAGSLILNSSSGFDRETGGTGVVRVRADSGDYFYGTYTGVSGATLTGFTGGRFGTTDAAAGVGKAVTECGYVYGHPHEALRKILTSTGAGTNGAYDVLPASWGIGLPASYVSSDVSVWQSRYEPGSGPTVEIDWVIDPQIELTLESGWRLGQPYVGLTSEVQGPPADGRALVDTLSPLGIWLSLRQGQITVRSALYATRASLDTYVTDTIEDVDVAEILSVEPWDSRTTVTYRSVSVTDGTHTETYTRSSDHRHLPVVAEHEIDVSRLIWQTGATRESTFGLIAEMVGGWAVQVPGVVRLRLRRWAAARLCLGDVVRLRLERAGVAFDGTPCVVSALTIFDGASSTVELTFPEGEVEGALA